MGLTVQAVNMEQPEERTDWEVHKILGSDVQDQPFGLFLANANPDAHGQTTGHR